MNAVGSGGHRDVDAIIHQQARTVSSADCAQRGSEFIEITPAQILFAELKRGVDGRRLTSKGSQHLVAHFSNIARCHQAAVANQVELEVDKWKRGAVQAETLANQLAERA